VLRVDPRITMRPMADDPDTPGREKLKKPVICWVSQNPSANFASSLIRSGVQGGENVIVGWTS
jgi:hypothetical protein